MVNFPDEKMSGEGDAPVPVPYFSSQQQLAQRADQLADAVGRLLRVNRELENEVRTHAAAEKALQERLDGLLQSLEHEKELSSMKTRFIGLASHEFRTPLSTILSSASLAGRYAEAGNAEKRDQHLEKIRTTVNHLTGILHDFLTVTQLEEDRTRLRLAPFDFCELVQERIESVRSLERPGLKIHFEAPQSGIQVLTDRGLLLEVVQNLLTNAARYSKKDVRCHAQPKDGTVHFIVKDEGIGIPEGEQRHIFERFFRASNASNHQGMGLGLHISKRCIELIGGYIGFESREGTGTAFTLQFPMNAD